MSTVNAAANYFFSPFDSSKDAGFFGSRNAGETMGFIAASIGLVGAALGLIQDNSKTKTCGAITFLLGVAGIALSNISSIKPSSTKDKEKIKSQSTDRWNDDQDYSRSTFQASQELDSDIVSTSRTAAEELEQTQPAAYKGKITVDTAALDRWVDWRVLVDTMQNHVDETRIQKANLWKAGKKQEAQDLKADIVFVLKDGQRVSVYDSRWKDVKHEEVAEVVFSDQGEGYNKQRLECIFRQ